MPVEREQLTRAKEKLLHRKNELEEQMNRVESINRELKNAQEEYRSAVDQCDEIRSVYAHLERLFLDAQAGILAQNLQAGMPCPVCGSIHHPAPAKLSEEIPDQKELKRKEQEKAQAEEKVQRLSERASFFKRNLDQEMRNTAELICGTEKNLVKEALIVTGPDELVTAADPVIEKLDDELRALEIRIKANTEQQKVLDGLGGMINRLETDLNAAGERNKELALSEQNLVTVLTMLRKHVEEFQRKLEGQNAVEIENNLQAMKTRKSELDQEAIDAKKALERFQNQNASLNSAAEALKKQIQGFEDIPEKELSETMEYLETEKAETSKLREKIHSSWHNNLRIYEAVCGQQGRMEQTEKEYVWIHSLADTAGGTLNGKSKVELETYVQMAYFDRILQRTV